MPVFDLTDTSTVKECVSQKLTPRDPNANWPRGSVQFAHQGYGAGYGVAFDTSDTLTWICRP